MPHSESYAKRLLRKLPGQLSVLLERDKYWDLTFLRVYLDECDEVLFDDPKTGLELAGLAVDLALRIPERCPFDWQRASESEKQCYVDLLARSHATLGGAYRATGKLRAAAGAYRSAHEIEDGGQMSLMARADLAMRYAKLLSAQREFPTAIKLAEEALRAFRDKDRIQYANALITKGYVLGEDSRHTEALPFFAQALQLIRPNRRVSSRASRVFHCAVHNLADALSRGCFTKDVISALSFIAEAKRFFSGQRNSLNKQKFIWVEARVHARLGCGGLAERRLITAHKKLIELEAPLEAALVALDLSLLYAQWDEWDKVEQLSIRTSEDFRALSTHTEALAALRLWAEGVREKSLTAEKVRSTRDLIEAAVARNRPGRRRLWLRGEGQKA